MSGFWQLVLWTTVLMPAWAVAGAGGAVESIGVSEYYGAAREEAMVSIASRQRQTVRRSPSVVSVVITSGCERAVARDSLCIADRGAHTLFDALAYVPGFVPARAVSGDRTLVVRGVRSLDGVLVMIDGVPVNDPVDGSFPFFDMPLVGVERVEIIRGPGSALYGGYALVAVVNIITGDGEAGWYSETAQSHGGLGQDKTGGGRGSFSFRHDTGGMRWAANGAVSVEPGTRWPIYGDASTLQNTRGDPEQRYALERGASLVHADGSAGGVEDSVLGYLNFRVSRGGGSISALLAHRDVHPFVSYENSSYWDERFRRREQLLGVAARHGMELADGLELVLSLFESAVVRESSGDITGPRVHGIDPASPNAEVGLAVWGDGRNERRKHISSTFGAELLLAWTPVPENRLQLGVVYEHQVVTGIEHEANFRGPGKDDGWVGERVFYADHEAALGGDFSTRSVDLSGRHPWLSERTKITQGKGDYSSNVGRQVVSAFVQDVWDLTRAIAVTSGVRMDSFSDFGVAITPRLGLVGVFADLNIKLLYGRAFKPPAFVQLYDQAVVEDSGKVVLQGNSKLKAPTIDTVEASLGYRSRALSVVITAFALATHNEINVGSDWLRWRNSESRESHGYEAELGYRHGAFQGRLGMSYFRSSGIGVGFGAPISPALTGLAEARYGVGKWDLLLGCVVRAANARESNDDRRPRPDTVDLEAAVRYEPFPGVGLQLSAKNLLNERIVDQLPVSLALSGDLPGAGRRVWLGFDWEL